MQQENMLSQLQQIQCDLKSGLRTLEQVELMLSEESPPNCYSDALYVIYTCLQGTYQELVQWSWAYEQAELP